MEPLRSDAPGLTAIPKNTLMEAGTAQRVQQMPFPFRLTTKREVLHFRRPARTSRGTLHTRELYRIHVQTPLGEGVGECGIMPGLSPEEGAHYPRLLEAACREVEQQGGLQPGQWMHAPSIRFGMETALLSACCGERPRWDSPLSRGERGLEIHHLIWMDSAEAMLCRMEDGVKKGFRRLKLKVGALPFGEECEMLAEARRRFPQVELYVDANGAFRPEEALSRLEALATIGINCIEQPLAPGQTKELAQLIRHSPLPIALDEELIPAQTTTARHHLLETLCPHAIVIKPSLHGGLSGAEEWAALADEAGLRWWLNSALESHLGLDVLAEWCGYHAPNSVQGLSTGRLYEDDTPGIFRLEGTELRRVPQFPEKTTVPSSTANSPEGF